jgi:hypothetical protein
MMPSFLTQTGYGSEIVQASYEYDDNTNTVDIKINWNGREVSGLLSDDQITDIEAACYDHERKLALIEKVNAANDKLADLFKEAA